MYVPHILSLLLLTCCTTDAMQQQEATEQNCGSNQHCPCAERLKTVENHAYFLYRTAIENIKAMTAYLVRMSQEQQNIAAVVRSAMMQQQQTLFMPPLLPSSVSSITDAQPSPSPQSPPSSEQILDLEFPEAPKIGDIPTRSTLRLKNATQLSVHKRVKMRRNEIIAVLEKEGPMHRNEIFQKLVTKGTLALMTKDLAYLRAQGTLEKSNKRWNIAQKI